MKIATEFTPYGWTAIDEDSYDGTPDSTPKERAVGQGPSEQDAIDDLYERLDYIRCDKCGEWVHYASRVSMDDGRYGKEFCSGECYTEFDIDRHATAIDLAHDMAKGR